MTIGKGRGALLENLTFKAVSKIGARLPSKTLQRFAVVWHGPGIGVCRMFYITRKLKNNLSFSIIELS